MATSYHRGHKIYWSRGLAAWCYSDTRVLISLWENRPCKKCGQPPTKQGYDACKGYVKGATSVCCGHGVEGENYDYEGGNE